MEDRSLLRRLSTLTQEGGDGPAGPLANLAPSLGGTSLLTEAVDRSPAGAALGNLQQTLGSTLSPSSIPGPLGPALSPALGPALDGAAPLLGAGGHSLADVPALAGSETGRAGEGAPGAADGIASRSNAGSDVQTTEQTTERSSLENATLASAQTGQTEQMAETAQPDAIEQSSVTSEASTAETSASASEASAAERGSEREASESGAATEADSPGAAGAEPTTANAASASPGAPGAAPAGSPSDAAATAAGQAPAGPAAAAQGVGGGGASGGAGGPATGQAGAGGGGAAAGGGGGAAAPGAAPAAGNAAGAGPAAQAAPGAETAQAPSAPPALDASAAADAGGDGMAALATGDLALIDGELAEHQRWAGAAAHVGEAGSTQRAAFICEAAGGGLLNGFAQGAAQGLKWGLIGRAAAEFVPIPGVGQIIGGYQALSGLAERDWSATGATIGKFGEGGDTYEVLANSIASVAEVIDVVTNIMNVVAGVIGVISAALWVVAAAAGVAAIFTLGATAAIAVAAGELATTLGEVALGISEVSNVLGMINSLILQPCVLLFRSLHEFTSQADPREVETQGAGLSQAAAAAGGQLGGLAGGALANAGAGGGRGEDEGEPPRPGASEPPEGSVAPAGGDGPTVHFEEPPVTAGGPDAPPGAAPDATPGSVPDVDPLAPTVPAPPPEVDPLAPTVPALAPNEPVSPGEAPTERPSWAPDLENPDIPPPPRVPNIETPGDYGIESPVTPTDPSPYAPTVPAPAPDAPAPAAPVSGPVEPQGAQPAPAPADDLHGMQVETLGDPNDPHVAQAMNDLRTMTDADIDAWADGIAPHDEGGAARSDTYFEMDAAGLQAIETRINDNPNQIAYNVNHYMSDVASVRIADAADVPIGAPRGPGGSVIPEGVGIDAQPVPETHLADAADNPVLNTEGDPTGSRNVELRYHSANPNAPAGSYSNQEPTVQINTPSDRFGWAGDRTIAVEGQEGMYLLPDGRWVPMGGGTPEADRAAAHWPVGQSVAGPEPNGGGGGGGNGGGGAPPPDGAPPAPAPAPDGPAPGLPAAEGGTRNQVPLTPEQFEQYSARAVAKGMPPDQIQQVQNTPTSYGPAFDQLLIGPDIVPLPPEQRPADLPNPANAALEPDAVLAHEIIGHREAALADQAHVMPWAEEAQASFRAALHDDTLPPDQQQLLIQDANARFRFQERPGTVYMYMDRNAPVPADQLGPGSQSPGTTQSGSEPSVIVDPAYLAAADPGRTSDAGAGGGGGGGGGGGDSGGGGGGAGGGTRRYIPMDDAGEPIPLDRHPATGPGGVGVDMPRPDPEAQGPHTVLGGKISSETGELYRQSAAFPGPSWPRANGEDAPTHETHWGTHGRADHADPHVHGYHYDGFNKQWRRGPAQGTIVPTRESDETPPTSGPPPSGGGPTSGGGAPPPAGPAPASPAPAGSAPAGPAPATPVPGSSPSANTDAAERTPALLANQAGNMAGAQQPGVARVNPSYPEPPGTPDQLAAIQDEIANLLGARAQAEQSEAAMAAQEQQHQVNQEHAAQAVQSTAGALTATQAHQQAVTRRTQANQQQQQRQQESQSLVSGYPSRAAGVAAIRIPLAAFRGFLYIATELPGDAGAAMQQMADDADRMDQAFTQMDLSMDQQADAQPARQQELQGDQSRLEATDQQAQASQDTLQQASEGAQAFQQENDQRLQQATQGREEAAQQKGELDEAVDAKQQQAETFAQELQGWAGEHQAARQAAIQATSQQIEQQGYVVREVQEA